MLCFLLCLLVSKKLPKIRCHVVEKGKNQHVVKREDGWAVRGEDNDKDASRYRTQQEAAEAARDNRTESEK
jgi:hypothetical protein